MTSTPSCLVWLRRDLRCHDHAALHYAISHSQRIWCCFLFDTDILDSLPRADARVAFIHKSLALLNAELQQLAVKAQNPHAAQVQICFAHGRAVDEIPQLAQSLGAAQVIASHDDELASLQRDQKVQDALQSMGIGWHSLKDHVVFERNEVLTQGHTPYGVFTPYKNAWLRQLLSNPEVIQAYSTEGLGAALAPVPPSKQSSCTYKQPSLTEIGFEEPPSDHFEYSPLQAGTAAGQILLSNFTQRIDAYDRQRDFPAIKGPSYLSVHLRFGTLSIRELAKMAFVRMQVGSKGAEIWLSELIWRDFYHQIMYHHPRVCKGQAYKPEYDEIEWASGTWADTAFQAWCEGKTGYPLVDAAMLQLNQSGYMHNRLRMVTACFLIKDLGIDWRKGEAYFAEKLIDFDFAANNGGWQWAASSGCDAQPYFRIFNPISQSEKFDSEGKFIRKYLPELGHLDNKGIHAPWLATGFNSAQYPAPIVDHAKAREATLARYAVVKVKK